MSIGALVVSALPAAAASPSVPSGLAFEFPVTHTPVLAATVADPDGGNVAGQFFAKRAGASTWDLVNGTKVTVASGATARLPLPALPAGQRVQWQVAACDASTCSAPSAVQTGRVQPELGAGARKNATTLPFQLGDRVAASVDVGTGNLMVTAAGLTAPGVNGDFPVDLAYNSVTIGSGGLADQDAAPYGRGWMPSSGMVLTTEPDGSVVLWAGSGQAATFKKTGATFTPPAGITADLVAVTGGGWTLTDHASQQKWTFNAGGYPLSVADRNGNAHQFSYGAIQGLPTTVSATRGGGDQDVDATYSTSQLLEIAQGPASDRRTMEFHYDGNLDLVAITDAAGRDTEFEYTDHLLTAVYAPGDVRTHFSYDSNGRVIAVRQVEPDAGDAWTRLAYTSETQTLVSDAEQEQAGSPSSGPHTTYTLTSDKLGRVASATDAEGRQRSSTFTPNIDPATQVQGSGTGAQTTSYAYTANAGESLTSRATQSGAATTWAYGNTAAATKYLPTSSTDDNGKTTLYTYNGAGNQLTTSDALAAQAVLTYNTDGTVATATAPGNTGNPTTYGYDAGKQLTSITPPNGTSLGVRNMTYDQYGRLASGTNGAGVTTTYGYDDLDRLTRVDYSGTSASPDVAFDYDGAGRLAERTDASGTTTYAYDRMNRLLERAHDRDDDPVSYTYDKSSRLATTTDGRGTTTYEYDAAGAQTAQVTAIGGQESWTRFAVDDKGRRTDTWLATNADNTQFAAHSHTDYDPSGRISAIWADRAGTGGSITEVVDTTYCYSTNAAQPGCTGGTAAGDRSMLQWKRNNLTGQVTTYAYDDANRLIGADVTAGNGGQPAQSYDYTYDARGNRLTAVGPDGTRSRTYNAGNQTTTAGFAYDGAGNLTADPEVGTMGYTAGDQLDSVARTGQTYEYLYAGIGNTELVAQTTPDGEYEYTLGRTDQLGQPLIEQVRHGGETAYIEHDALGTPLSLWTEAAETGLYVYDNLGSPLALIADDNSTETVVEFDPYGVPEVLEDGAGVGVAFTPFLYTGGLNDRTTTWTLNGARYYDAYEGRWTQMDTLDAPLDPANGNRYAYAANNPVNFTDPTGLASGVACAFGIAGVVFTAASSGPAWAVVGGYAVSAYGVATGCISNSSDGSPYPGWAGRASQQRDAQGCFVNSSNGSRWCP
ncbi:RHS repeat domain-containing protein [Cellulomonas endometrii]|uniref:RHS repeat domain-containing protein n=1 Tax=Cellulomonas endometrii TaxID=3036301 RepID=UPI0024AE366D|nr:RHS repeat-associated core domain-containing protein [Cellulomonas endometrii]